MFFSLFYYLLRDFFPKYHGLCNLLQEDRASETGPEAEIRESTLSVHACFLIKNLSQRDEHVRDISNTLLTQLREKFPQVTCTLVLSSSFIHFQAPILRIPVNGFMTCRYCGIHHVWMLSYFQCTMIHLLL